MHGSDPGRFFTRVELLAQVVDVKVDYVGVGTGGAAPDGVKQQRPGEDLTRSLHQSGEQGKLLGREVDALSGTPYLVARRIQRNVTGCQDRHLRLVFGWPARKGPYPREKFGKGERLGKVVVGPGIQALDAVFDLGAGREHQDRDANVRRPESLDDLDPVEVRQHPVDHQQVERLYEGTGEGRAAVGDRLGGVSLSAQDLGEKPGQVLLVLHDQYPHHYRLEQSYPSTAAGAALL